MQQQGIPPALTELSTRPSSIMSQRAGRGRSLQEVWARPWQTTSWKSRRWAAVEKRKELRGGIGCFCKGNSGGGPKGRFYTVLVRQADGSGAGTTFQCTGCRCCLPALHGMRLCAEVRSWFRETQQMHQSTLRLKLRVLHLAKRSLQRCDAPPHAPLSSPWQRQTAWPAFAGHCDKALSSASARTAKAEAAVVAKRSFNKPAWKRPAVKLERWTPFTRRRVSKLHVMGKKQRMETYFCREKKRSCWRLPFESHPCSNVGNNISLERCTLTVMGKTKPHVCMRSVWPSG